MGSSNKLCMAPQCFYPFGRPIRGAGTRCKICASPLHTCCTYGTNRVGMRRCQSCHYVKHVRPAGVVITDIPPATVTPAPAPALDSLPAPRTPHPTQTPLPPPPPVESPAHCNFPGCSHGSSDLALHKCQNWHTCGNWFHHMCLSGASAEASYIEALPGHASCWDCIPSVAKSVAVVAPLADLGADATAEVLMRDPVFVAQCLRRQAEALAAFKAAKEVAEVGPSEAVKARQGVCTFSP
jgi:hypothetical protein